MSEEPQRLVLDVWPDAADPEAGRWLAALDRVRRGTNELLDEIEPGAIDADPGDGGDSLGTVIYHLALVEVDWVYSDILDRESDISREMFPHDDRESDGRLTPVTGESMAEQRARLDRARSMIIEVIAGLSSEEFLRVRPRSWGEASAAWIVFHLIDHEVEHRVRIARIRDAFRR